MNIFELSNKTHISVKSLRKLEKLKIDFGALDDEPDDFLHAAKIRFVLMRKGQLTVEQLLQLIVDPSLFDMLKKYEARARAQIAALGDYQATLAPREVTAVIDRAAGAEADAALILAQWFGDVLPAEPVGHHWVAVRLLLPLPVFQREKAMSLVSLALMHMRKLDAFRPYWESIENKSGRKEIRYFQPKTLDL